MIVVNKAEVERLMIEKGVSKYTFLKKYNMQYTTFYNVIEGKASIRLIGVFCDALGCQPCDILTRVKDD